MSSALPTDVSAARLSDGSISLRLCTGGDGGVETSLVLPNALAGQVARQLFDALGLDVREHLYPSRQPNEASRRALAEHEADMPTFTSPDDLFGDLDG